MGNILFMKDIKKSFSGVQVLRNINLELNEGEVLALIGENGAGKSTLMKILKGEVKRDSGEIVIDGKQIDELTPDIATKLGISMIHQELTPIPDMTVAENLFLGREPSFMGVVNHQKM